MSEMEQMKVTEAMNKAEREINLTEEDISRENKIKIALLESSITDIIQDKDYAEVKKQYLRINPILKQGPEEILATFKIQYDKADRSNHEIGSMQLKQLSDMTITKLSDLKTELLRYQSQGEEALVAAGKEIGKKSGGDRMIAKPGGLEENMDQVEQLLGLEPRMRIEAYQETNNNLLVKLKQPSNVTKYIIAKATYSSLTDGLYLEDANQMLNDNIKRTLEKIKTLDPAKTRAEMLKLVEKQLEMLRGIYRVLASAFSSSPEPQPVQEKPEEKVPESQKISDEEMAKVFDVLFESVRWSKDNGTVEMPKDVSGYIRSYSDVGVSYSMITGRKSDEIGHFGNPLLDYTLGTTESQVVGAARGGVNAIAGIAAFGTDVIDSATKLAASRVYGVDSGLKTWTEKRTEWGEKAADFYKFLSGLPAMVGRNMNMESVKMLGQFIMSGMENTTQAERVMLLNQIMADMVVGELIGGKILDVLSSKGLGSVVSKLSTLSAMPGVSSVLKASKFILSNCPSLAKYGYRAEQIALKLKSLGRVATEVYDVFLETQDTVGDIQGTYNATVGAIPVAYEKVEAEKMKFAPVYKDLMDAKKDIMEALKYSVEIGLGEAGVRDLKEQLVRIDARLSTIKG